MSTPELPERAAENGRDKLSGWKEIADHLGKGVRTAQRWETELGLPIHRLPGAGREIIFAFRSEIDRWLLSNSEISNSEDEAVDPQETATKQTDLPRADPSPRAYWYANPKLLRSWAVVSTALLLAIVLVVFLNSSAANRVGPPGQYRLDPDANTLVVTDKRGHELWTTDFDAPVLKWRYYSDEALTTMHPPVWFGDLDGDSRRETVFLYDPVTRARSGSLLFCYLEQGGEKWRFAPGKRVRDAKAVYDPPFTIQNFVVSDLYKNGERQVLVTSHHFSAQPNQFVILNESGEITSEYWHSGFLELIDVLDLDKDGVQEILLAGTNNGHHSATLVVLDPRNFSGTSEQPPGDWSQLRGFDTRKEKAVILFPRSCISRQFEEYNRAVMLAANGESIRVEVAEKEGDWGARVTYILDRSLEITDVLPTDRFKTLHRELWLSGKLDHEFSLKEIAELRNVRLFSYGIR